MLDITNGAKPVEVARLKLTDDYIPHWTSWDAKHTARRRDRGPEYARPLVSA